jgi:hypothetical protein
MPSNYYIIDTIEAVANKRLFRTSWVGLDPQLGSSWNALIYNYPDSLQNKYVNWTFRLSGGNSTGIAQFRKDGVMLDTVSFTNNSIPVFHEDTFATGNFDTLQYRARGIGNDTVVFYVGVFQIRTEIRIDVVTTLENFTPNYVNVNVYPNPTEGWLYFDDLNLTQGESFRLFDIEGKLLRDGLIQEKKMDLSGFEKGLYLLVIPNSGVSLKIQKL